MIVSIIWFLVILSVIVISHEFGHFLLARMNGIHVLEFSLGMGPTLLHFKRKDTVFSLKLLPLGGSCRFEGEDGLEDKESKKLSDVIYADNNINTDSEEVEHLKREGAADSDINKAKSSAGIGFNEAPVWARISCVFAGPFFNFILALLFAMVIVGQAGTDLPLVSGVTEGRPAEAAGLKEGDIITSINGESIHIWRDISLISVLNSGESLKIEYTRDGQSGSCVIVPQYVAEDGRYYIGIEGGLYSEVKGVSLFKYSWYEMIFNFRQTLKSLKMLVLGKLSADDLAGPVGIAQVVDENYDAAKEYGTKSVILTMMNLAMLLSVNLGVLNLLPLPALDGGRLVFLFVEVVRKKPVPPEKEGMVHLIGIILFFILAFFIFVNDIRRIIG